MFCLWESYIEDPSDTLSYSIGKQWTHHYCLQVNQRSHPTVEMESRPVIQDSGLAVQSWIGYLFIPHDSLSFKRSPAHPPFMPVGI